MGKMKWWDWTALTLLIIGGVNWGLAVFNFNLVESAFGVNWFTKLIYGLVGISAIYSVKLFFKK